MRHTITSQKEKGISFRIDSDMLEKLEILRGTKTLSEYIRSRLRNDIEWVLKLNQVIQNIDNINKKTETFLQDIGLKVDNMVEKNNKRLTDLESQMSDLSTRVKALDRLLRDYILIVTTDLAKNELKRKGSLEL
jgi:hypothetical protein